MSLSSLEKDMMYFVENDPDACPDPMDISDRFEAQYHTAEFEKKVSALMHGAYKRLKREDTNRAKLWNQSMRLLTQGDHYLPVLWSVSFGPDRPLRDLAIGLFIAVVVATTIFLVAK